MRRCVPFLLLSLLLLGCGQPQLANANKIDAELLIGSIGTFVPQAKPLIDAALAIWKDFLELKKLFDHIPDKPSDREIIEYIQERLKGVGNDVKALGEKVEESKKDVTQEVAKDTKLLLIERDILTVESQFNTFLGYRRHKAENDTQRTFYQSVIQQGTCSLTTLLDLIHSSVTDTKTSVELPSLIVDPQQSLALMCKWKQSPMHVLNNLLNQITAAELKAMILVRYAYWYIDNGISKHENAIASYDANVKSRLDKTISFMKYYMKNARRDFWTCNSGNTYKKLSPIFFTTVVAEDDMEAILKNGDLKPQNNDENCAYYNRTKSYLTCRSPHCRYMTKTLNKGCGSYIRDCYTNQWDNTIEVCIAKNDTDRQYNKMKIGNKVFGKDIECKYAKLKGEWDVTVYREQCMCTCDDEFVESNRYFSLKEATSDIDQNKVITGVKIILVDTAFQFEIQQAAVTNFGNVNETTVEWKREPKDVHGASYYSHRINYDNRTVNLDVLDGPPNTVLTGLRFGVTETAAVQLEIRYTPINFESGKLDAANSKWIIPDKDEYRPEIKFNTDLPKGNWFTPDPRQRAYLKFAMSSLEDDIGQNVLPFIDVARVASFPSTLLSGAGLIYKGSSISSGFLSMKLITYNFEPHMKDSLNIEKH